MATLSRKENIKGEKYKTVKFQAYESSYLRGKSHF